MTPDLKRRALTAAKLYLEMRGFKIIEQNFQRAQYNIDFIAQKGQTLHFIEVNYHKDTDARVPEINATHLKRVRNAAYTWLEDSKWGGDYTFSTLEIAGQDFIVMDFIENTL